MTYVSISLEMYAHFPSVADSASGYFARVKKAWFLGNFLGLEYTRSDLEASRRLEGELRMMFPS